VFSRFRFYTIDYISFFDDDRIPLPEYSGRMYALSSDCRRAVSTVHVSGLPALTHLSVHRLLSSSLQKWHMAHAPPSCSVKDSGA
jgi:hypothetical protein